MLFVPTVFNAISFWVTDTFIRHYKPQPCIPSKISHVGSENSDEEGKNPFQSLYVLVLSKTEGEKY